jgi:two-component system, NarL family, response regulator DegU
LPMRKPETGHLEGSEFSGTDIQPLIRVLLADPDTEYREQIKTAIKRTKNMVMVGECTDGIDVPLLCGSTKPHVAVINLYLPRIDGVEVTNRLCQMAPQTKVLILSEHADPYVIETIRSGAAGYMLKDMKVEPIIEAIRVIAHGGVYIHPIMMGRLVNEFRRLSRMEGSICYHYALTPSIPWQEVLTYREMEVLRLMSQGKNNRSISEHLFISEKTVKNHVSNILYKLNVQDRTQAVLLAMKYGWVQLI